MPHLKLPDGVALYYEQFQPPKPSPSLLLLAPSWLDSTFLEPYVREFQNDFGITTLELRCQGRSTGPIDPDYPLMYDLWCAAADIAYVMNELQLPPSHLLGAGCVVFTAALKAATLFPQHILSLSLVGGQTLFSIPKNVDVFLQIDEEWVRPDSAEHWLEVLEAIGEFMLGKKVYAGWERVWDRVIPASVRRLNPYRPRDVWLQTEAVHRKSGVTPEMLAELKQPVLLIHGDNDTVFDVKDVQAQTQHFKGVEEIRFHVLPGGPHQLLISHAPAVIAHMQSFLSRRPRNVLPFLPIDFQSALSRAASIAGRTEIGKRDPRRPDSFSLVTPEEWKIGRERLLDYMRQETECEVPLPMCFEKNDWEEGADQQRRFTWSGRVEYLQRCMVDNSRPHSYASVEDGVVVQVEQEVETVQKSAQGSSRAPLQGASAESVHSSGASDAGGGARRHSGSRESSQLDQASYGILQGTVGGSYGPFPHEFSPRRASHADRRQSSSMGLDPPSLPYASSLTSPSSSTSGFDHTGGAESPLFDGPAKSSSSHSIPRLQGVSSAVATHGVLFEEEPDDFLHSYDEKLEKHMDRQWQSRFSWMALFNTTVLVVVILVILGLFAGWPIYRFAIVGSWGTLPPTTIMNSTGQVPMIENLPGLIDRDTPEEAYTRTGLDGEKYELVFSDEFNVDGRTFWPGDDPYWEAVDLHCTRDLQWYDPDAITTRDGKLVITLDQTPTNNLNFRSGMLQSWNKFCFTGGYMEVNVSLPGVPTAQGFWPGIWTMGNLGRPGYGGSNDGVWPYTYNACDVGTLPNQTWSNGTDPVAAKTSGSRDYGGELSYLSGQRLSACTCPEDEDLHPGPNVRTGRGAPEIDALEGAIWSTGDRGSASQSTQIAPFTAGYLWRNETPYIETNDAQWTIKQNQWHGSVTQESLSLEVMTDSTSYSGGAGTYTSYGFEYDPGPDGSIRWAINGTSTWTLHASAIGPSEEAQISQRDISEEPMSIVLNLGISESFQQPEWGKIRFPGEFLIDSVRVYQKENHKNIGCDPKDHPTSDYINKFPDLYNNPNITVFTDSKYTRPRNSLAAGGCG
ncbi:hypothetical protein JCM8547_009065 [Rhodosporidiobolus lusitaniae]